MARQLHPLEDAIPFLEREKRASSLNSVLSFKWYMEMLCSEFGRPDAGKALLLDKDTMTMMSMVYSMSEALRRNVYNMERLDKERLPATASLECIVFVRPTAFNVSFLMDELKNPHYCQYHIVWNNVIQDKNTKIVEDIAKADEYKLVASMKEYYGDFYAVHDTLFHFDLPLYNKSFEARTIDGMMAVLLAHKRNPCIKYQASSPRCEKFAKALETRITDQGEHMVFRQPNGTPTLFVFDRREDPVTPLLKPWTYQAMIHELITIVYNRVDLKGGRGQGDEAKEHVINPGFKPPSADTRGEYVDEAQDEFFAAHMFKNFGEIGMLLKEAIEANASSSKLSKASGASIEELQALVAEMPEMRHKNMIAMKHWDIFKAMKQEVDVRRMFEVSAIEQNLATRQEHDQAKEDVKNQVDLLAGKDCIKDALRLVMLYHLRYEKSSSCKTEEFLSMLMSGGLMQDDVAMVKKVVQYGGQDARNGPGAKLMGNETASRKLVSAFAGKTDWIFGSDSAYELIQHTPLVAKILDDLAEGKLGGDEYPEIGQKSESMPKEIILFIIGGATYAEAAVVNDWNASHPQCKVMLGGTFVHNSTTFLEEVASAV
jgi:hypothetical protein